VITVNGKGKGGSTLVQSMKTMKAAWFVLVLALAFASPASAQVSGTCENDRSPNAAMWLSIAHPGLGEWYLKSWGPIEKAPQHKFWFGFIPFYGWPGYLQVVSAIDAANCRTKDHGE